MKRLLLILLIAFTWFTGYSQKRNHVNAAIDFTLVNKTVTAISEDTSGASKSTSKLITENASKEYADNLVGKYEYVAYLKQDTTTAPIATVRNASAANYLGAIVWTRTGVGRYTGTLAGKFADKKTFIIFENDSEAISATDIRFLKGAYATTGTVTIAADKVNITTPGVAAADGCLNRLIRIIVYN